MVVLLGGGEVPGPRKELLPGPCVTPKDECFRNAYSAMADRAGLTLTQAVAARYDLIDQMLFEAEFEADIDGAEGADCDLVSLRSELAAFGGGPPLGLACDGAERMKWFDDWLAMQATDANQSLNMTSFFEDAFALLSVSVRTVQVASPGKVRTAIDSHPILEWDDNLADACSRTGTVLEDDREDGTSRVRFASPADFVAWLPQCVLTEVAC